MKTDTKRKRADWDQYFMDVAKVVSSRSTCDRKFVGAVIVRDKTILSTGYNGSIRKLEHCDQVGHMMENDHCVATVHAEANAILQAAKNGVAIDGGTMYITASPCWPCFKLMANSGVKRICFGEFYRDERIFEIAKKAGIELVKLDPAKGLAPAPAAEPARAAHGAKNGRR
jgi:dCMP deaminase